VYFLDTNTCIYFLNGKYESVRARLLETPPGEVAIPAVVKAELLFGAYKSRNWLENTKKVEQFLEPFDVVAFSGDVAAEYADIRLATESSGNVIGPNDLMIAAVARFHNAVLITHNIREFSRVPNLKTRDWVT